MGGHSCYEGGHRTHRGLPSLPPLGKTLHSVVLILEPYRSPSDAVCVAVIHWSKGNKIIWKVPIEVTWLHWKTKHNRLKLGKSSGLSISNLWKRGDEPAYLSLNEIALMIFFWTLKSGTRVVGCVNPHTEIPYPYEVNEQNNEECKSFNVSGVTKCLTLKKMPVVPASFFENSVMWCFHVSVTSIRMSKYFR